MKILFEKERSYDRGQNGEEKKKWLWVMKRGNNY